MPSETSALTISPPILDMTAAPGEKITPIISLENETQSPLKLYAAVEGFAPAAGKGEPEFFPTSEGLPSWIRLNETELLLSSGESRKLLININVPEEAKPGSYYAAVFYGSASAEGVSGGAAIASRLGALVFLRVEGKVEEQLSLKSFGAKKIYTEFPAVFEARVSNGGNVDMVPKGEIVIRSWTGKKVAFLPWNEANLRVLPQMDRTIFSSWESKNFFEKFVRGLFGYYSASILISYGSPVKQLSDLQYFWVLPLKTMALSALILLAVIIAVRYGIKSYNRRIVRKHLGH